MLESLASQSHTSVEAHDAKHASQHEVPTIICPICDAVYAPSLSLLSFFSLDMLESAFMSMCHFCFRCRRPACPQCWDSVHGVCGECVREANLSFRSEAAPLDGLLFRPLRKQEEDRPEVASQLLTCVKPGLFLQDGAQVPVALAETTSVTSEHIPAFLPDLRESVEDVQHEATLIIPVAEVPQRVTEKVAIVQTANADREEKDESEEGQYRSHSVVRVLRVLERVLTVLALVLLLTIIGLIIAAQASKTANTGILHVLHVDIRAEVAYLVHLIQQLRQ